MFTLSCHGRSTAARLVALSLTVYTTIGCRSSRIFPLAGQRYCTCASDVTAVTAASASRYFKCVSFKPTRLPEVLSIKDSENISKNPGIF